MGGSVQQVAGAVYDVLVRRPAWEQVLFGRGARSANKRWG
jgi:hypothetical protein